MSFGLRKWVMAVALIFSAMLVAGCSSSGKSAGGSGDGGSGPVQEQDDCLGLACGVLDEAQEILDNLLGGTIANALPEPLGHVVGCGSDALVNLIDVPDALISALSNGVTSQDPLVVITAAGDVGDAFGNVLQNMFGMFVGLVDGDSECGIDGGTIELPLVGDGGILPNGPTGTPLDIALAPIIEGLRLFVGDGLGGGSGPASIVIDPIKNAFGAILGVIQGGSPLDFDLSDFDLGNGQNDMLAALLQLSNQLDAAAVLPSLPGDGGDGAYSLGPLAGVVGSIQDAIAVALGSAGGSLVDSAGSDIPVIGGLLSALQNGFIDNFNIMNAISGQDGGLINAGIEQLLENSLIGALTEVLPLRLLGDAASVDIAGELRNRIGQGVAAIGDGTVLLGPLFGILQGGGSLPNVDIAEEFISGLLSSAPVQLSSLLSGGLAQLYGSIGQIIPSASGADSASLGLLDVLLGGLGQVGENGSPFDLLLGALVDNDPSGILGGLLGAITNGVQGIFGIFTGLFS